MKTKAPAETPTPKPAAAKVPNDAEIKAAIKDRTKKIATHQTIQK